MRSRRACARSRLARSRVAQVCHIDKYFEGIASMRSLPPTRLEGAKSFADKVAALLRAAPSPHPKPQPHRASPMHGGCVCSGRKTAWPCVRPMATHRRCGSTGAPTSLRSAARLTTRRGCSRRRISTSTSGRASRREPSCRSRWSSPTRARLTSSRATRFSWHARARRVPASAHTGAVARGPCLRAHPAPLGTLCRSLLGAAR
jgi:hypothetical protein